jgi:hypothetical protein
MNNFKIVSKIEKKWDCTIDKFNAIKGEINDRLNTDINNCMDKLQDVTRYECIPEEFRSFVQLEDIKKYGHKQKRIQDYYYPKMMELFDTIEYFLHIDDIQTATAIIDLNLNDDYTKELFDEVVISLYIDYIPDSLTAKVFLRPKLTETIVHSIERI